MSRIAKTGLIVATVCTALTLGACVSDGYYSGGATYSTYPYTRPYVYPSSNIYLRYSSPRYYHGYQPYYYPRHYYPRHYYQRPHGYIRPGPRYQYRGYQHYRGHQQYRGQRHYRGHQQYRGQRHMHRASPRGVHRGSHRGSHRGHR
jgi:hypothetical protein